MRLNITDFVKNLGDTQIILLAWCFSMGSLLAWPRSPWGRAPTGTHPPEGPESRWDHVQTGSASGS